MNHFYFSSFFYQNLDSLKDSPPMLMRLAVPKLPHILVPVLDNPISQKKKLNPENLLKNLIQTISSKEAPNINLHSVNLSQIEASLTAFKQNNLVHAKDLKA